jgi:hypothetical protein
MTYGYIRVSTDKQTVENQRFEINHFCDKNVLIVDKWIEETISGAKGVQDRKLGKLLKRMRKGDVLICSELSRLGRNLLMIMGILNECMNRDIEVWTIKDNYRLGSDVNSIYAEHSGKCLEDLTHSEDPWLKARIGVPSYLACNNEITLKSMKDFYSKLSGAKE